MSPYVSRIIKEYSIEEDQAVELWKSYKEKYCIGKQIKESDLSSKDFMSIMESIKRYVEKILFVDVSDFINSEMTAQQFIENVVSADFSVDQAVIDNRPKIDKETIISDKEETEIDPDKLETKEPEEGGERALESVEQVDLIDKFIDEEMTNT